MSENRCPVLGGLEPLRVRGGKGGIKPQWCGYVYYVDHFDDFMGVYVFQNFLL